MSIQVRPPQSGCPLGQEQTPPAAQLPLEQLVFDVPAVWLAQVPLLLPVSAALQAWHIPLHILLQQYPLTQLPLLHWLADAQAAPFPSRGAATQLPVPLQTSLLPHVVPFGYWQAPLEQVPPHAPWPHVKPQPPQLFGSLEMLTQALPHSVCPGAPQAGTQAPLAQT
jgi:hypothetical protein